MVVPEVFLAPGGLSALVKQMFLGGPVVSHDCTILCQTVPRVFDSFGRGVFHVGLQQPVIQQWVDLRMLDTSIWAGAARASRRVGSV